MSSIIKVNTVQDTDGNNIINENANTITIGKSGDTVQVASGASLVGAGIEWQSTVVTGATHTASAGQGLWLDTSSNAITLTLPSSPSVGDQIIFTDYARNWGTNAVTLTLNGSKFQGNTTPVPVYDTNGESVDIVYSGSTKGWIPNTDGAVALETPQYNGSFDILVVAGGGGGGSYYYGGGGGAGGYRTSTQTVSAGNTLTVTVGDGGAAGTGNGGKGTTGNDSSISGPGLTTITSAGGGGGGSDGSPNDVGRNGGSGGAGSGYSSGSSSRGIGNTPSTSPAQGFDGGYNSQATDYGGGGGGGASEVGGISSNDNGADGGDGVASSITGSSVTRAGGGGGNGSNDGGAGGTAGAGGAGGGGTGARQSPAVAATAGTANTGGGGGAGSDPAALAAAGGKGVVIISMTDGDYSGTTTGSPTVATGVSGKTVLTFNGSGSYTT